MGAPKSANASMLELLGIPEREGLSEAVDDLKAGLVPPICVVSSPPNRANKSFEVEDEAASGTGG